MIDEVFVFVFGTLDFKNFESAPAFLEKQRLDTYRLRVCVFWSIQFLTWSRIEP